MHIGRILVMAGVVAAAGCGRTAERAEDAGTATAGPSGDAYVQRSYRAPNPLVDIAAVRLPGTNEAAWAVVAAGEDHVVVRSADDGRSWQLVWPADPSAPDWERVAAGGPGEVWLLSRDELLYSSDAGVSWRKANKPSSSFYYFGAIAVRPGACDLIAPPGYGASVYRTTDGGATWTKLPGQLPHNDYEAVVFRTHEAGWLAGPGGRTARTVDGGATWSEGALGTSAGTAAAGRLGALGGWCLPGYNHDGHVRLTEDDGATWQALPFDIRPYWNFRDVAAGAPERMLVLASRGADGARLLDRSGQVIFDTAFLLVAVDSTPGTLWFAAQDGGVYRAADPR